MSELDAMAEVADAALNLVCLWESQNIAGLSRQQRNRAIEDTRKRLVAAVQVFAAEQQADDAEEVSLGPAAMKEAEHG